MLSCSKPLALAGTMRLIAALGALVTIAAAVPAVKIEAWGDNSLRVRFAPQGNAIVNPPFTPLLDSPPGGVERSSSTQLDNGNLRATSDPTTGFITFTRISDGAILLKQTGLSFGPAPAGCSNGSTSALLSFSGVTQQETIVGFGSQQDGQVVKKLPFFRSIEAAEYYPYNHGSQALIPLYFSSIGYGFLWDLPTYGYMSLSNDGIQWFANATQGGIVDFWVTTTPSDLPAGGSPYPSLLKQYADAVGHAPQLPAFATGFIQSKDRYRNQTQLLQVARGYVARQLPIQLIVIDWFHWKTLGDMSFNPACWPDPQGMVDELKSMGIELMVTFWPFINSSSVNWDTFATNGWMGINRTSGKPDQFWGCAACQNSFGSLIDATQPDVRAAVFERWWQNYGVYGIRAIWEDETEPDRGEKSERCGW